MAFRIRLARTTDVEEILVLEGSVAEAPHWPREEYAAMLERATAETVRRCLLVAERAEQDAVRGVVGFAVGKVIGVGKDSFGELESVVVAEDARRLGAGRSLCEGVLEWCKEEGAGGVELEVRSRNDSARRLYCGLGFVEEGLRRGYYRAPEDDAVLMRIGFPRVTEVDPRD